MLEQYLQLGTVAIIFLFSIKEYFSWQKSRKNNGSNANILKELQLMNSNHLTSICKVIGSGDKDIVKAINDMNINLGNKLDLMSNDINRLIGRSDK